MIGRQLLCLLILLGALLSAAGCKPNAEPEGYKKDDFAKAPVPPGYGPPKSGPNAGNPGPGK